MKKKLLILFNLLSLSLLAQERNFTIEINYPITIDNNFLGKNFNGVVDLGISHNTFRIDDIGIDLSSNFGFFSNKNTDNKVSGFLVQPQLTGTYNFQENIPFKPFLSFGYTFFTSDVSGDKNFDVFGENNTFHGININLGVSYDLSKKIFTQIQYDFVNLNSGNIPNTDFNSKINLIKLGIGYKLQ